MFGLLFYTGTALAGGYTAIMYRDKLVPLAKKVAGAVKDVFSHPKEAFNKAAELGSGIVHSADKSREWVDKKVDFVEHVNEFVDDPKQVVSDEINKIFNGSGVTSDQNTSYDAAIKTDATNSGKIIADSSAGTLSDKMNYAGRNASYNGGDRGIFSWLINAFTGASGNGGNGFNFADPMKVALGGGALAALSKAFFGTDFVNPKLALAVIGTAFAASNWGQIKDFAHGIAPDLVDGSGEKVPDRIILPDELAHDAPAPEM